MESGELVRLLPETIKKRAASNRLKLPVFPGAAFELRQLLKSDSASLDRISEIIGKDQAMASHMLKLANSALYSRMNRKIRTIKDAVMHLGSDHILNLVICTFQHDYYKSQDKRLAKYLQTLWQHALCVAIGSKWLINVTGNQKLGEEAFLAGLLHDIGKLLIIKVIETLNYPDIDVNDPQIMEIIQSMHSQAGAKLLQSWNISPEYCSICLNHHEADFDPGDALQVSVRISDRVSGKLGISTNPEAPGDTTELSEARTPAIDEKVLCDLETVMLDAVQSEYSMLNESLLDNSVPYGIYV